MENNFKDQSQEICMRLSYVFSPDINDSFEIVKPLKLIFRSEILNQYVRFSSLFFQSLSVNDELIVDDKEAYIKKLFEDHIDHFILVFRRMLKNESINDYDFLLGFAGGYYGKLISQDYILERLVFKFNDDGLLSKYSFLKPYLNNTAIPQTDFDTDIFKNETGFLIFKDYAQFHVSNQYKDFGFIFQSLKKDKLILNIPHIDFAKWLNTKNYITQKTYDEIYLKKVFESLIKLSSETRLNSYIRLKEKYLK